MEAVSTRTQNLVEAGYFGLSLNCVIEMVPLGTLNGARSARFAR